VVRDRDVLRQPGDTVGITAGSYGSQSVTGTKGSPGCVFKADPGTTISNLNVAASWFGIDDATIGSYGWNNPSPLPSHVTFRNINPTSEVFMKGGSYISILGGSVHDFNAGNAPAAMHIEGQQSTSRPRARGGRCSCGSGLMIPPKRRMIRAVTVH
jgi:hypothetical protein